MDDSPADESDNDGKDTVRPDGFFKKHTSKQSHEQWSGKRDGHHFG